MNHFSITCGTVPIKNGMRMVNSDKELNFLPKTRHFFLKTNTSVQREDQIHLETPLLQKKANVHMTL